MVRALVVLGLVVSGCASAPPVVVSAEQTAAFQRVVREAEVEGAGGGTSVTSCQLHEAKSDFYYAQHLPMYPDRARALAAKAQNEAVAALACARLEKARRAALNATLLTEAP